MHMPAPVLWPVKGTSNLAVVQQAKAAVASAEAEERNRLLYVALTRARDRLYIAGFEGFRGLPQDCWYNIVRDGLADRLEEITTADGRVVWRLEGAQTAKHESAKATPTDATRVAPLPAWVTQSAPIEPLITVPLAPSRLAPLESDAEGDPIHRPPSRLADPAILPPAALAEDARFLRGTVTHALLEHLPALPKESWAAAAQAFVDSRASQLPASARAAIVAEAIAVLREQAFAALFGPDARAEVAIAAEIPHPFGRGPALRLNGKIDRLVRNGDGILIVDYKTNRPPPSDPADVAETYLLQLAGYRLAVGRIFPQTHVRAAILWTDGPRIMAIPGELLDAAEQRLWQLDPANLDA
jgi:ATP-dependent helicase/nuclease subunit A